MCKLLGDAEVHPKLWSAKPINPDQPVDWLSIERKRHNAQRTPEKQAARAKKLSARDGARRKKWAELGIDYDFAAAPSRESLEQQGARFVKLPRDLYDEMSALCDAQRRGELSAADQLLLTQLMRSISLQVAAGLG